MLAGPALCGDQRGAGLVNFGQDLVEHLGKHIGIAAKTQQRLLLAFEFLQQVGLEIGAAGNFQHLEDGGEGDVVMQRMALTYKKSKLVVQVF